MTIRNATPEDSRLIADAILSAIGDELTDNLAGENHTREEVHAMFMRLASEGNTQYSYRNTRIAVSDDGSPMGVCVSYDGADLKRLRRPFFAEANAVLGWNLSAEEIENLPGETSDDEFYLDTLMTLPEYRCHGVAKSLIEDATTKAARHRKPLGLLCDFDNIRALRLYESVGFINIGARPFAGHEMHHLRKTSSRLEV